MPFYDYVCTSCGHEMEVMHSVHDQGPEVCPRCGGAMKKALAAPAVHFKGSGWARKEKSSKPSKAGGSKEPAAESTGSSGSSDTSPAKEGD